MNDVENLKEKTISGLFWRFAERITAQLITFIVSIILARILLPQEYGIIAIVMIFINIANVFVTSGLGTSLVQKKNADKKDFDTMFWSRIVIDILFYLLIFLIAPILGKLYKNDFLIVIIRVMAIKLPIASISSIQQAYVSRKMIYKKFFWSTLFGTIVSAVIGIYMAYKGYGVWALVSQYLSNSIIDTLVLFITIDYRPNIYYSFNRFKVLFSYGWKIMMASLIGTIFDQLRGLIIGAKYTPSDLAYNNKGEQFPLLLTSNLNNSMESVLFSSISKIQDEPQKLRNVTKKLVKISCFVLCPLLFGLAGVSKSLVTVLLTEKWLPCVPFLIIICYQQFFGIINTVNMQVIKAVGRSDVILKLEFIKKPIYILIILITLFINPLAICIGNMIYSLITLFINSKYNKEIINYTLKEEIIDVYKYIIISIIMQLVVVLVGLLGINVYIKLVLQIIIGGFVYLLFTNLLKIDYLSDCKRYLKSILNNRKKGV